MANQKAVSMTTGIPGVEVAIIYNDANGRISNVEWTVEPSGVAVRCRIWDSNVSDTEPIVDRTEGQGNGAENIPGNYSMVTVEDPDWGTQLQLPDNLTYQFNIRTI